MEGFVDKNNDLLYRDLSQAMYKANHSIIRALFPEGNPAKVNLKRPPTAGFQFRASVATLMKNLQTKNPNYIRLVLQSALWLLQSKKGDQNPFVRPEVTHMPMPSSL